MNFDLDKQRHQFGVLLVLFILVYSSIADEPRKGKNELDSRWPDVNIERDCAYQNAWEAQYGLDEDECIAIVELKNEYTVSYFFRCTILLFAALFAYISFSDDDSEDNG